MIVQWNLMGTAGRWEPPGGPKPAWVLVAPKEELSALGLRASRGQSCLGMGEKKRKRERRERGKGRRRGKRRVRLQELSVPRPRGKTGKACSGPGGTRWGVTSGWVVVWWGQRQATAPQRGEGSCGLRSRTPDPNPGPGAPSTTLLGDPGRVTDPVWAEVTGQRT